MREHMPGKIKNLPAFLILIAAAGCATQPQPPAPAAAPAVNLSGYPPAFRQGYTDGCASVNAARKRDEARFKSDANYATGWRDGYSICKSR
ncbi:MAG: hypothetical protein Q8O70_08075 [Burkholderiales bacterium]|nr:hypothetical protein [Burkholderiales bacterium]